MNRLVSIVITTYNGEKYIVEQLQSILNQDYPELEVIILDDNSSDYTVRVVDNFIKENNLFKYWRVICNRKNVGWRQNFYNGLELCRGKYIFPCDQDDIWCNNKVSCMVSVMEMNENINVLASNIIEFNSKGKEHIRPLKEDGKIQKHKTVKNFFNNEYPGCAFCIRRSFFEEIKSYWWYKVPHDALFWRYSMFSNSLYTIGLSLIKQRIHQDSTYHIESIKGKNRKAKVEEIDYMLKEVKNLKKFVYSKCNLDVDLLTILEDAEKWLVARKRLYEKFGGINCIKLCKYINFYERKRKYILDILLASKIKK